MKKIESFLTKKVKKEVNKMKKIEVILSVAVLALVFFAASAYAVTVDKTVSVTAGGTITGSTALSVSPASIAFGTTSADSFPTNPSNAKVVITYSSNYNPWQIRVYTNNTQVPNKAGDTTGYGRYAKGGLATADGKAVVSCKWVAKTGTNTTVPAVPTGANLYNFIKDIRDEDDPSTASTDESWTAAQTAGYPNIAYGDATGGHCVDPSNTTSGPTQYQGDAVTPTSGVAVYIAAQWATGGMSPADPAGAGTYNSNINFDLYHP